MFKNIGSNWLLNIYTVVVVLIMGRFVVATLGPPGDGVRQMVVAATGLLSLLVLGVPMASVRYFSEKLARDDKQGFNQTVGSCVGLYLLLGLLALAAGALLWFPFEAGYMAAGRISEAWRADATLAYWLMVLYIAFGFVAQVPYGVMVAHHDFVLRNLIMMAGLAVKLGLVVGLLSFKPAIFELVLAQMGALGFEFLVAWRIMGRRYPGVRLSLKNHDSRIMRQVMGFSLFVLFLQLGIKLSFYIDSLVIGWFMPQQTASYYERANTFNVYLVEFLVAIGSVVMPLATRFKVHSRLGELGPIFLKWSKVAAVLTAAAVTFLGVLGPEFVAAWLGKPEYQAPAQEVLPVLMASGLLFLPVRGVALPLLMGLGVAAFPTLAFLGAGLLNLGLSIFLAPRLGLFGVALGTALPNALYALVLMVYTCRQAKLSLRSYLGYVFPRTLLACLPLLALLLWMKNVWALKSFPGVVLEGGLAALFFALLALLFIFRGDPHLDLLARWKERFLGSKK